MSEAPFRTGTVTAIAIVSGVALAFALVLALFGPELGPEGRTHGPDAYSRSALGHEGLVRALQALDVPVLVSRFDSARKARASGVLVLVEPTHGDATTRNGTPLLEELIASSDFTLLVLPKRRAWPLPTHAGWVGPSDLLDVTEVERLLQELGLSTTVTREEGPAIEPIQTRIGAVPTFEAGEPVQVVSGQAFLPLVTTNGGGTLLARVERRPGLYILSDPDPISNADFHRGENVRFFLRMLNHIRDGYQSVVFDETIHGFEASPSVWRELLVFPLVLVPIHLALLLALTVWAGMGRFGTPRAAPPPLRKGLAFLVDRTAALLLLGRTKRQALPRYLDVALRDARRALDGPATLRDDALDAWLDRIGESRGARERVHALRQAVARSRDHPGDVLDVAARIHRWKTEILHGLSDVRILREGLHQQVHRVVIGQNRALDLCLLALLCRGHVLIEGVPGTAKTLLARAFAACLRLDFQRVQFTPDLMPGDVIGTNLFDFRSNTFHLTKGPIFTDLLLADEINRTPPKTQAALLQAMQERTVTIDGKTHALGTGFMVLATQNPIEQEGTYPLPEAQLDRFLFKAEMGYPSRDQEREIVTRHGRGSGMPDLSKLDLLPVGDLEAIEKARQAVEQVRIAPEIVDYIVDIVRATRERPSLICGASPRSAAVLSGASAALAALNGRDFVIPDDVKNLAVPALAHRVLLSPSAEIEGLDAPTVIRQVVDETTAPR